MKKTVHVGFRLPPQVKADAVKAATKEGRKLSGWLAKLVADALKPKRKKA